MHFQVVWVIPLTSRRQLKLLTREVYPIDASTALSRNLRWCVIPITFDRCDLTGPNKKLPLVVSSTIPVAMRQQGNDSPSVVSFGPAGSTSLQRYVDGE
jgi:hypothetical protein